MFYLTTGIYLFGIIIFELLGSTVPPEWAIDKADKKNSSGKK